MNRLSIAVNDRPRFTVVSLAGDLDKLSASALEETLSTLLARGRVHIIVDVRELRFCDSTGVWALLSGLRRVYERNGWLRLAGVHGFLGRLLDLTRLRDAFPIDASVDESVLRAFEGSVPLPL
ncbi:STAS domain-containing protein [Streptosporangium sp. NPDC004379]|uniref:STAS domain-containing protein n=1 Tax=Streptosporangium sp. NPDC004379 TaxID=3366189 RepID=UPI0036A24795